MEMSANAAKADAEILSERQMDTNRKPEKMKIQANKEICPVEYNTFEKRNSPQILNLSWFYLR